MKIKELKLTNFRRFEEFRIDFDPRLTVLLATNGSVKTSILDAIALALGPFLTRLPGVKGKSPNKDRDLRVDPNRTKSPYMRIAASNFDEVHWDRTEKRDQSKKTTESIPSAIGSKKLLEYVDRFIDAFNEGRAFELPVFIYYGTGRGVFDVPQRKKNWGRDFSRFDALNGALESKTDFKRFVEYFYFLEQKEHKLQKEKQDFGLQIPELKAIRSAIKRCMPAFSNPSGAYPAGIYLDWSVDHDTKKLRIEQLSDGFRTTLAMIMDIAARMGDAAETTLQANQYNG